MSPKFTAALLCALCCLLPARRAAAGLTLSGSVGLGYQTSPEHAMQATNLMIAPGYDVAGLLRLELGIVGSLQAARARQTEGLGLEFRPMEVISPPLLPLYLRLVLATVNPFSSHRTIAYGGALGIGVSLIGIGAFAEAGLLPRSEAHVISWILEGRVGVKYAF